MTWLFFILRNKLGRYTPLSNGTYKWLWERYGSRRHQSRLLDLALVALALTTLLEGSVARTYGILSRQWRLTESLEEECIARSVVLEGIEKMNSTDQSRTVNE